MTYKDLFLTPVYLVLIYAIAYAIRGRVTTIDTRRFFIPALSVKLLGAIAFGLVYNFYYSGGDTFNYFKQGSVIYDAFWENPLVGIKLLFANGGYDPDTWKYASKIYWYNAPREFFVIKIATFIGFFCFYTYLPISLFFALISFSGVWAMYITFLKLFPELRVKFAIACFFIPSLFFWGSGLMKDTICIGALGWLFWAFYKVFVEKKGVFLGVLMLIISSWAIMKAKPYILLAFSLPAIIWIFIENNSKIKNSTLRFFAKPFTLGAGTILGVIVLTYLSYVNPYFSVEGIAERTAINANYLYRVSVRDDGSAYNLGELDGSFQSIILLFPSAVNVTLFRPYLFEVKNILMLFSSLESTFYLFFAVFVLFRMGFLNFFKKIITNPFLQMCFLFTVIFAFSIGVSSYNFGSLVRYKIPLIPFFTCMLFVLYDYKKLLRKP